MKFLTGFDKIATYDESIEITEGKWKAVATIEFCDTHIDGDDSYNLDQKITGCSYEQQKILVRARNAWFDNEWFYCGVVVTVSKNGIELGEDSLWGIECNYPNSDNSYLLEVANELIKGALDAARATLAELIAD